MTWLMNSDCHPSADPADVTIMNHITPTDPSGNRKLAGQERCAG